MWAKLNEFLGWTNCAQEKRYILPLVHLNLIVYSASFWMFQPNLPLKLKSLDFTEVEYGTLQSLNAILALFGSITMGRIIDHFGMKRSLMLCHFSAICTALAVSHATTKELMFASQLPCFFMHGMLCCQSGVALLVGPTFRAHAFGRLGLSYAIGMGLGSPLGGWLGMDVSLYFSILASLCIFLADLVGLPHESKTTTTSETTTTTTTTTPSQMNMHEVLTVLRRNSRVRILLGISFCGSVGPGAFRAMLPMVFVEEQFGTQQELGLFMSYVALLLLITNVLVVGPLVHRFGERNTVLGALFGGGLSFFLGAMLPLGAGFAWAIQLPQSIGLSLFYTVSGSLLSNSASKEFQGTVVSLSHVARSFSSVVGPIIGATVMHYFSFQGLRILAGASLWGAAVLALVLLESGPMVLAADEKKRE